MTLSNFWVLKVSLKSKILVTINKIICVCFCIFLGWLNCFYTFWCLNYRYWSVMGFTQDILCSLMNGYNVGSSGPTTASFVTSAYLNSFLYARNKFIIFLSWCCNFFLSYNYKGKRVRLYLSCSLRTYFLTCCSFILLTFTVCSGVLYT